MRLLLVGTTLVWTAVGALLTFISIHITNLGGDLGTVGLTWAVGAAVEIPIMLLFPLLARRVGAERLLLLGAVAFALRAAGWALADDPFVAVLVAPLGGVGFALFYVGLVTLVAAAVPAEAQATAQGIFSAMSYSLGAVVGSALGGAVAPLIGLPGLFALSALATLGGAAVLGRAVSIVRPGSLLSSGRAPGRKPRAA
jgi:PPP family 3-phenylpropionic acid transporter